MIRSDATRRGFRTFLDVAFVEALIQLAIAFGLTLDEAQHAAILVIAPFFVSALKNAAEDRGTIPALLKAPASDGADPIPDDRGHTDTTSVVIVVLLVLAVFLLVL